MSKAVWQTKKNDPLVLERLIDRLNISQLCAEILAGRGYDATTAAAFLSPQHGKPPSVESEMGAGFASALDLLLVAIHERQQICLLGGAFHSEGVIGACALMRAIRHLGGVCFFQSPLLDLDGSGLGACTVRSLHARGVKLLLCINQGQNTAAAIAQARVLGINVIVCDHHEPQANGIQTANVTLNPRTAVKDTASFYYYLLGSGLAYALGYLAVKKMEALSPELGSMLVELFALSILADDAPLLGCNRRALKRGLTSLAHSQIPGIQAIARLRSLAVDDVQALKREVVERLVGSCRAGRTMDVVDLLTTNSSNRARELVRELESVQAQRLALAAAPIQTATAFLERLDFDPAHVGFICLTNPGWSPTILDLMATQLANRYGCPAFIGHQTTTGLIVGSTYCPDSGIDFELPKALAFCDDVLLQWRGDRQSGSFSLRATSFNAFFEKLGVFCRESYVWQPPSFSLDAVIDLHQCTLSLCEELARFEPTGCHNPRPVFLVKNVRIVNQIQTQGHLKLLVVDAVNPTHPVKAIGWGMADCFPLPDCLDLVGTLRIEVYDARASVAINLLAHDAVS